MLNYIEPDFVHVMVAGRLVRSGGSEIALELEQDGYKNWKTLKRVSPSDGAGIPKTA
jgi:Fe-S cluster assembly ATPase SufC